MNRHSTQVELSKRNRSLLHLPAQLTVFLQTPFKSPTAFWAHYCLHRKWQSSYSHAPRCVHCIFWLILCKIPVLDFWQPSQDCMLAGRAKCPSWTFIQHIEKDFGFLIKIFLLFQGSMFGLGALLWHSVPRVQPWDKYWMTAYVVNKAKVSAGDNNKKPNHQTFCTSQESTQKHPVGTTEPRIRDEVLPRPPRLQPLSLFQWSRESWAAFSASISSQTSACVLCESEAFRWKCSHYT